MLSCVELYLVPLSLHRISNLLAYVATFLVASVSTASEASPLWKNLLSIRNYSCFFIYFFADL